MGRELKYIEDNISRNMTFSRRRATIFNKADTLARLFNTDVAILITSPGELPYTHGTPSFDDVVEHLRNSGAVSSARQARIRKDQAKLDRLTKELELSKEREIVLKKRKETTLKKYNIKDVKDLKLEDLVSFKEKLEALRLEMEASSSSSSSEWNFLSNRKRNMYGLRPRAPRNYLE